MSRFTRAWIGFVAACATCFIAGPLLAQSPLHGAWHTVAVWGENDEGEWEAENLQPNLYLFLDNHYSVMRVSGEEPRPLMPEDATRDSLSDEQMRSIFMPFVANSGTYAIDGSTVTMTPMVALWPNFMESGSVSYSFQADEGEVILTFAGDEYETHIRLQRLE